MTNNNSKEEIRMKPRVHLSEAQIFGSHIALFNKILTKGERKTLGGNKGIHLSNNQNYERRG